MRDQKGITLVALVVTIIVLLILAGVTMAMVVGNDGIFTKANTAKTETAKADFLSSVKLAMLNAKVNSYTNTGAVDTAKQITSVDGMITAVLADLNAGDYPNAKKGTTAGTIENGETGDKLVTVTIELKGTNFTAAVK